MQSKLIPFLFLVLLQISFISSLDIFTAEKMHSLHRLSSFIASPDGQYIIYVNRIWKKEDNKYYTNLEYIKKDQNPAVPIEITNFQFRISKSPFFLKNRIRFFKYLLYRFSPNEKFRPKKINFI